MWRAPLGAGAKVALPEAAQACVKPAALPPHKQSYTREPTGQQDLGGGGGGWDSAQGTYHLCALKFRIKLGNTFPFGILPAGEYTAERSGGC